MKQKVGINLEGCSRKHEATGRSLDFGSNNSLAKENLPMMYRFVCHLSFLSGEQWCGSQREIDGGEGMVAGAS